MGGLLPGDAFRDALFENPGTRNHWVTLELRGDEGEPLRRRLRASQVDVAQARRRAARVHLVAGSGGSFGASSLQQEVGLGDAVRIVRVSVRWPAGPTQVFEGLPLDRSVELVEGGEFRVLERPLLTLGP